jgi:ankyrin repeat protein
MAAKKGHNQIVNLLLTYHANVTLRNTRGQTALDVAQGYVIQNALRAAEPMQA